MAEHDAEWVRQNTACEHGHQRRKCQHCEIVELESFLSDD